MAKSKPITTNPTEWNELIYNAYDLISTSLSHDRLVDEGALDMARFDHACLGPALTMTLRGLRVDERAVADVRQQTHDDARRWHKKLDKLLGCEHKFTWGRSIKPSPHELKRVLYDHFHAPMQLNREQKPTTNKDALAKILESPRTSEEAAECALWALELSRLEEDRKVLDKPRGVDGRFYTSFGVAADVTSRWNSKRSTFGDGANMQAMSKRLRRIFIAEDGCKFLSVDQEQAESLGVAYLAGSDRYIAMHQRGNVHMEIGSILWPGVAKSKDDAKIKKTPWNPDMSYYDLFKRRQHAGNYGQTAWGFARLAHIPVAEAERSGAAYFHAIPEIPRWQNFIRASVRDTKRLTTPMGRIRQFLGRTWDESTMKEAIAHVPQSTISDINKIILFRIWRDLDPHLATILLEIHDGNLMQYAEQDEAEIVERVRELARVTIPVADIHGKVRELTIPVSVETGHNWMDHSANENPDGLRVVKTA